ncbi:MAG TPA: Hsp20/alpha crystallin family protein [Urbifossiella sp.]
MATTQEERKTQESKSSESTAPRESSKENPKDSRGQDRNRASESQPAKTTAESRQNTALAKPRETSMASYGGWSPMIRLREEFDRLYDRFFSRDLWDFPATRNNWGFDVRQDENTVTVRAEAPGFEPDDFDIQVRGGQLVMCACRSNEGDKQSQGWSRNEFYETVTLPAEVDSEKVKAAYRNGVLTVSLPKTESSKGRRIRVES